ncbi:MAG: ATP-binding cassette domain-containing protein [Chloroherpetonaceae bacterium]|nr:ATP-binding cassette domain-containing protein [Chloroherpetonaceae bacterium]
MPRIEVKSVTIYKGNEPLLDNISFTIPDANLTLIIDADGDSETELVNLMGGILVPDEGAVFLDDVNLFEGTEEEVLNVRRNLSFVFQNGGLISNLSVLENLLLPLNLYFPEKSRAEKIERIRHELNRFELPDILEKRPAELPRRLAKMIGFIRAIVIDPKVIIMDEPFANCDVSIREKIFREIMRQKLAGTTLIAASSSSEAIFNVADWLILLDDGKVIKTGEAQELVGLSSGPAHDIVKRYLGG